MEPYEVVEYKGFKINIYPDDSAESPRERDNLGKMVCFHRRYSLGDKHKFSSPSSFHRELAMELDPELERRIDYWENGDGWIHLQPDYKAADKKVHNLIEKTIDKNCIMLPLYLYDHSGITMSTGPFSCPWDSGQVGYIYISIQDIKKEYSWKVLTKEHRRLIEDVLQSEVRVYDYFIRGDVFGYKILDPDGEERDSCWGFYSSNHEKSGLLDSAKEFIDWIRGDENETHNPVTQPSL